MFAIGCQITHKVGEIRVMWPKFKISDPSVTDKAMQNPLLTNENLTPKGTWLMSRYQFRNFGTPLISSEWWGPSSKNGVTWPRFVRAATAFCLVSSQKWSVLFSMLFDLSPLHHVLNWQEQMRFCVMTKSDNDNFLHGPPRCLTLVAGPHGLKFFYDSTTYCHILWSLDQNARMWSVSSS